MFRRPARAFLLLLLLAILLVVVDLPENYPLKASVFGRTIDTVINPPVINIRLPWLTFRKDIRTHLGLDISGGTHIVLEADMANIAAADRVSAQESAKQVIERRVNFFGLSEPVVQSSQFRDTYRIIVDLPGVKDIQSAVSVIGQTASLEFREFTDPAAATGAALVLPSFLNTAPVGISGKDLKRAAVTFSSQTGEPEVAIEFTPEGGTKFGEVTTRLVDKHLAIFLDEFPVTWPVVRSAITDGRGVISGSFDQETAKVLALQLNAGALPVPVKPVEMRTIEASLGRDSIAKSIRAGGIGLLVVAVFMVANYGALGLIADMALVMYGLLTLALFRLIPVTLTLPGIAGFILSIGMAVDSNILIFERYKEELRRGKPWHIAMELAFGKAWDSIRDANLTTILTAFILYNPGNWQWLPSSGLVRGFAATLLIGVLISLFTGIVVTRTFIRVLYKPRVAKGVS